MQACFEKLSGREEIKHKSCNPVQSATGQSTPPLVICPVSASCSGERQWRSLSGCTNTEKLTTDKKVASPAQAACPAQGMEGLILPEGQCQLCPSSPPQLPLATPACHQPEAFRNDFLKLSSDPRNLIIR